MPKAKDRPKQKQGESDAAFKERMDAWKTAYHAEMLRSQAAARVPRVVAAILSVGALASHNPKPHQAEAIITPLETALKNAKAKLQGTAAAQPAFKLPD
jgi:hypothetical protein